MDEQLLELKVLLKRWEVDFLRQHKRKPSSGDVAVQPDIAAKYEEYQALKRSSSQLQNSVSIAKPPREASHKPPESSYMFGYRPVVSLSDVPTCSQPLSLPVRARRSKQLPLPERSNGNGIAVSGATAVLPNCAPWHPSPPELAQRLPSAPVAESACSGGVPIATPLAPLSGAPTFPASFAVKRSVSRFAVQRDNLGGLCDMNFVLRPRDPTTAVKPTWSPSAVSASTVTNPAVTTAVKPTWSPSAVSASAVTNPAETSVAAGNRQPTGISCSSTTPKCRQSNSERPVHSPNEPSGSDSEDAPLAPKRQRTAIGSCDETVATRASVGDAAINGIDADVGESGGVPQSTLKLLSAAHVPKKRKRGASRKPQATKVKKEVSKNYVRTNLKRLYKPRRRPGARRPVPKWKQRWQRVGWKTRSQWKKDKEKSLNDSLYCEVLEVEEVQRMVRTDDEGDSAEEEVQELERKTGTAAVLSCDDLDDDHSGLCDSRRFVTPPTPSFALSEAAADAAHEGDYRVVLRELFGFSEFRPGQEDAIARILSNESVLLVLPTGGGKSLCYQLPALLLPGLTLVVSPLISLMQDQLLRLPCCLKGAVWNSAISPAEYASLMADLRQGVIKVLFVSPEKVLSPGFQHFLSSLPAPGVSFACVDEAHCVSEWSHNFRPSFLRLNTALRSAMGLSRILALTATATQQTAASICNSLGIDPAKGVIRCSLRRSNLTLNVSRDLDKQHALLQLLKSKPYCNVRSTIVYVLFKRDAQELAVFLQSKHLDAQCYHSGQSAQERKRIQQRFMNDKLRIVVATIAFGMGLDKQDVGAVIHYSLPRNLEGYVQEIGRAGRNGESAYCHTFFSEEDARRLRNLAHSNGAESANIRSLLGLVFKEKVNDRRQNDEQSSANSVGLFVALDIDDIEMELDLRSEAVSTVLTRLQLATPSCLTVIASFHNHAVIGFHDKLPRELAKSAGVVRAMLELDPEDKVLSGAYKIDLCQVANHLNIHVIDVQRELMRLRSLRQISIKWEQMAHVVQIHRWPSDLDELCDELCATLEQLEKTQVLKVDIVSAAFSKLTSNSKDFSSRSAIDPKSIKSGEASDSADNSTHTTQLMEIIQDYFFMSDNGEALLQRLQPKDSTAKAPKKTDDTDLIFLKGDMKLFISQNQNVISNGREVARIFHGISSSKFNASVWMRNPYWGRYCHAPFEECVTVADQCFRELSERKQTSRQ